MEGPTRYLDGIYRKQAQPLVTATRGLGFLLPNWPKVLSSILAVVIFGLGITMGVKALGDEVNFVNDLKRAIPSGHYLILFQNNSELRPTGGFIGSFATVDVDNFAYKNLTIDTNIYKRDNAFTELHTIDPPKPLAEISSGKWAMRDANWSPDFPTAAQQVAWFYKKEGGEDVNGVVAVNASVVQDILETTGPIELTSGDIITSSNFFDVLHFKVEKEYFFGNTNRATNEPKEVLVEFFGVLKYRLMSNPLLFAKALKVFQQDVQEKHVLFFNADPVVQGHIGALHWDGSVDTLSENYLSISNANINGGKSSLNVHQVIDVDVKSTGAGFDHRLTIVRDHQGLGIWPDHINNNYMRVLLPIDAQVSAVALNGNSIDNFVEDIVKGRTSIELFVNTIPGGKNILEINYSVPKSSDNYNLFYQKQPGVLAEDLKVTLDGRSIFNQRIAADTNISELK